MGPSTQWQATTARNQFPANRRFAKTTAPSERGPQDKTVYGWACLTVLVMGKPEPEGLWGNILRFRVTEHELFHHIGFDMRRLHSHFIMEDSTRAPSTRSEPNKGIAESKFAPTRA